MQKIALILAAALAACAPNAGPGSAAPASGEAVVRRMHDAYAGKWYRTLTFVQKTSRPDRPAETWYEAGSIPGKLRIDIAPIDSGNAFIYAGDSVYVFRSGKRIRAAKDRNLLMTLGFDVYGQPVETTLAQLREQNIDLSKVHEATWQGRTVWVVGATPGDSTASQFWVDKDRLLFVRLLERRQTPQGAAMLDIEFNRYQRLGGGWIAPEVVMRRDGQELMREEYSDMRADPPLDDDLYSTTEYRRPGWVR